MVVVLFWEDNTVVQHLRTARAAMQHRLPHTVAFYLPHRRSRLLTCAYRTSTRCYLPVLHATLVWVNLVYHLPIVITTMWSLFLLPQHRATAS